jgi:transposase
MSTEATHEPSAGKPDLESLFPLPEVESPQPQSPALPPGRPRLRRADRHQVEMRTLAIDALLAEDHQTRLVWQYVEGLDVSPLTAKIRSIEGAAGRNAMDPRIPLALWLYATLDGVGSARQLDRLCTDHVAYEWICGGVSVNDHTLSDFRTAHPAFLDALLTQSVATLVHQELVTLHRVAQDGMRVRASAGASSFRRRKTLEACQGEAAEQIASLRAELDADPDAGNRRRQSARRRAARERLEGVQRALAELADVEAKKKPKDASRDPHVPRPGDSETIGEWRARMGTPEAKAIYKERTSTAECVNAIARNRGLRQFLVRGLTKVRTVVLWFALAHNLMRSVALRAEAGLAVG